MKKIISLFCLVFTAIILTFSLTACNKTEYTYWQTDRQQAGETVLIYTAEISLGSSNVDITEVWINVSNLKAESTTITLKLAKSSSSSKTINCELTTKQVKASKDGWVQIHFDRGNAISCKTVTVEIVDAMRVNEIYFVKSNGEGATATFNKGGVMAGNSGTLLTRAELEALTEGHVAYNENQCYNIVDEQDKFPKEKIQTNAQ